MLVRGVESTSTRTFFASIYIVSATLLDQQVIVSLSQSDYENIHQYVSFDIHWIKMPREHLLIFFRKRFIFEYLFDNTGTTHHCSIENTCGLKIDLQKRIHSVSLLTLPDNGVTLSSRSFSLLSTRIFNSRLVFSSKCTAFSNGLKIV